MLTIMPDLVITRRKRVHMALDDHGQMVYSTASFTELLMWLDDNGQAEALIEADADTVYRLTIKRLPTARATFRVKPNKVELDPETKSALPL